MKGMKAIKTLSFIKNQGIQETHIAEVMVYIN